MHGQGSTQTNPIRNPHGLISFIAREAGTSYGKAFRWYNSDRSSAEPEEAARLRAAVATFQRRKAAESVTG